MWRIIAVTMSMNALVGFLALFLVPGLPLTFTWLRFSKQRTSRAPRGHLTLEFPLFVVTGSYLLYFGFLVILLVFMALPPDINGHGSLIVLVWSNAILSFVMSALALIGKHSLRWRLAGSAAAVSLGWVVVGVSILAVESAGRWVL